jgi:mannose-6-phosphate isomerase-like protein (cupin superfamily)
MKILYATALAMVLAGSALAQPARGTATDVPNADIQAALKATASAEVSDQQLRVVPINNGDFNVGAAVVHRKKVSATPETGGGGEHTDVTEIYSILSGQGTLVTGGTLISAKAPANGVGGPTMTGTGIMGGVARKVGPGDIIIIPPHTPHTFSEVTSDEIVYSIVRIDPHKVLTLK